MDKRALICSVISQLQAELDHLRISAKAAHEAATSEESKPENQYDTRALEASYLAAAQTKRVQELQRMIQVLEEFPASSCVIAGSGALLEVESDGSKHLYFLLPFGAGLSATSANVKATVVSLDSPLGKLFVGKKAGDSVEFKRAGSAKDYEIRSVF